MPADPFDPFDPNDFRPFPCPDPWTLARIIRALLKTLLILLVAFSLISLVFPVWNILSFQATRMKAASNAKQIIGLLVAYVGDHSGQYPDSVHPEVTTANQALRYPFIEELTKDERIFGSPASMFIPDGNIGSAPSFPATLEPGENHWSLIARRSLKTAPNEMLLIENPADSAWPPRWNTEAVEVPVPGRVWKRSRIVIGRNDGSVDIVTLSPGPGLQPIAPPKNSGTPFPFALDLTTSQTILPVELAPAR